MSDITHRNEQTASAPLDRVQGNVRDIIAALRMIPFLWRGKLISVDFPTGGVRQRVRHGLGVPAACIIVRQNYETGTATYAQIIEYLNASEDLTQYLGLICNVTARFDLWFYPRASKSIVAAQKQSIT